MVENSGAGVSFDVLCCNVQPGIEIDYATGDSALAEEQATEIATVLDTSIDRLYFGAPSEAFLNETEDFGETVVNCFKKLRNLGVVTSVRLRIRYGPERKAAVPHPGVARRPRGVSGHAHSG